MIPLADLTLADLQPWMQAARSPMTQGRVLSRIDHLATADPGWLAIEIATAHSQLRAGDCDRSVALMSVIKPFLYLYLLHHFDQQVAQWVGVQPSELAFNSLSQLTADRGQPRNCMINSGAITLADKLPGQSAADRVQRLADWLNQQAGCHLSLDSALLWAVRQSRRETNQAIAAQLVQSGAVQQGAIALDAYEQACCLAGSITDLAKLGQLLSLEQAHLKRQHRQQVNAVLLTCGLYEASAAMAGRVGLPMKSGVSGALLAIVPRQGAIAAYSPALDAIGNPIGGLYLVEKIAQHCNLSLFG